MQVCYVLMSVTFFFSKSALWDSVRLLKEAVNNFSVRGKMMILNYPTFSSDSRIDLVL